MSSFRTCLEACNLARSNAVPTPKSFGNSDQASEGPLETRKPAMRFYGTAFQPLAATAVVVAGKTYCRPGGCCVLVLRQFSARPRQTDGQIPNQGGVSVPFCAV